MRVRKPRKIWRRKAKKWAASGKARWKAAREKIMSIAMLAIPKMTWERIWEERMVRVFTPK
jgi:hypothetical protein